MFDERRSGLATPATGKKQGIRPLLWVYLWRVTCGDKTTTSSLFGLATYTAEQRAKEISIRKVMGASIPQVIVLLSKDFTVLVLIAFVIASPLAWYMAEGWLEGFANRINMEAWFVIISGLIATVIAMLTISFQSVKAARENPVNAMRSE